jgi:molybdopterin synthase sulfur carrier subunit
MAVRVLYFASVREAVGTASEDWSTSAATVAQLREELVARGAPWSEALASDRALRCAINQQMCAPGAAVQDGDEVAFFPPVTGG